MLYWWSNCPVWTIPYSLSLLTYPENIVTKISTTKCNFILTCTVEQIIIINYTGAYSMVVMKSDTDCSLCVVVSWWVMVGPTLCAQLDKSSSLLVYMFFMFWYLNRKEISNKFNVMPSLIIMCNFIDKGVMMLWCSVLRPKGMQLEIDAHYRQKRLRLCFDSSWKTWDLILLFRRWLCQTLY